MWHYLIMDINVIIWSRIIKSEHFVYSQAIDLHLDHELNTLNSKILPTSVLAPIRLMCTIKNFRMKCSILIITIQLI